MSQPAEAMVDGDDGDRDAAVKGINMGRYQVSLVCVRSGEPVQLRPSLVFIHCHVNKNVNITK